MTSWKNQAARNLVPFAALTAVVAFAFPAAAADSTTAVQASPSAATVGQPVHLTATVTCAEDPSGGQGVTFWDGGDILDTVPVAPDGQAVYPQDYLPSVGTHTITAAYNGNADCNASNAVTTVVVSAAPGLCLLTCGGVINYSIGDIHNHVNVYDESERPSRHHDY